jgi:hypothetical protein
MFYPPYNLFWLLAKYLTMVLDEKKVPWAVWSKGRVLKGEMVLKSEVVSWATS